MSAQQKASDELLAAIPEKDIVYEMAATLTRVSRWYLLHKRPIVSTDVGLYQKAFDEILVLDALPYGDTSGSVN